MSRSPKTFQEQRDPRPLSPRRRALFFAFTLLTPFGLVALLEVILRLLSYGPDLSLFMKDNVAGRTYYIMNPEVKDRYFYRVPFNPSTSPDYFSVPKPAGTYRIFCLGGSTTVGYPYWYNGSFSSFLRDRLHATFPEKKIDVINVGMTATNSFTVLDMARDLVRYEPDLFIVYDGHNEFYGALGIASHESMGSSRWAIETYLHLLHFRVFLLLRDAYAAVAGLFVKSEPSTTPQTMMEQLAVGQYVPYASREYHDALTMFQSNLADLQALCQQHGVPLIVATQVSNLRDQAPFISGDSEPRTALTETFDRRYNHGLDLFMQGKIDSALSCFRDAKGLDSSRADVHYRLAKCLDALGRRHEAEAEYIRARDLDQLRFRTSTDFNRAIMALGQHSIAVDMEEVFRNNSPDSLIGHSLITEHLHPNARGYFLIAKAYANAMRSHGLLADHAIWAARDTIRDESLWNARPVTEIDERLAQRRTDILTSTWPFRSGPPTVDAIQQTDTLGMIVEKMSRGQLAWPPAHEQAAEYYLRRGEKGRAAAEYRAVINQIPLDVQPYLKLARIELDLGNIEQVRTTLLSSLSVEKTSLAYRALGDIELNAGRAEQAALFYEKLPNFPESPAERLQNGYLLSLAYAQSNRTEKAAALLLEILRLKPDYQPAVNLLVKIRSHPAVH